jgi:hypothetical protein
MCLICVDFQRSAMTSKEARRALGELVAKLDPAHVREVETMLEHADEQGTTSATAPAAELPPSTGP